MLASTSNLGDCPNAKSVVIKAASAARSSLQQARSSAVVEHLQGFDALAGIMQFDEGVLEKQRSIFETKLLDANSGPVVRNQPQRSDNHPFRPVDNNPPPKSTPQPGEAVIQPQEAFVTPQDQVG